MRERRGGREKTEENKVQSEVIKKKIHSDFSKESQIWFLLSGLRNVFVPDYKDEIKEVHCFAIHMESEASIDFTKPPDLGYYPFQLCFHKAEQAVN